MVVVSSKLPGKNLSCSGEETQRMRRTGITPFLSYPSSKNSFKGIELQPKTSVQDTSIIASHKPLKAETKQQAFKGLLFGNARKDNISFTGKIPGPPEKVMNKLGPTGKKLVNSLWNPTGAIYKTLKLLSDVPALGEAAFILGITTLLRPATVMATPGPDKEDRKYAAAHSISTGLVTFGVGLLLFKPIANSAKRVAAKLLKQAENTADFKTVGKKAIDTLKNKNNSYNYATNMGFKFLTAPLQAAALILLIPIIVKNVFNRNSNKKAKKQFPPPFASKLDQKNRVKPFTMTINQKEHNLLQNIMRHDGGGIK